MDYVSEKPEPKSSTNVPAVRDSMTSGLMQSLKDLKSYKEFRDQLDKFITKEFKEGIHYGEPYEGAEKKTILLPGSQAIARLTQTKPMFFPDMELFEMMGRTPGVVAFKCYLVPYPVIPQIVNSILGGRIELMEPLCKLLCLAEGRGGGYIGEKKNKLKENTTIKMTQKRAFGDAAIRIADLSDKYSVDLEEFTKDELDWGFTEDKKSSKEDTVDGSDILGVDALGDENIEVPNKSANPLAEEAESTETPSDEL